MVFQESLNEHRVDAFIHGAGVVFGIAGGIGLVATVDSAAPFRTILSLSLYAFGLLAMLICSALYNLTRAGAHSDLFRRIDHAAVYLMIAGTYTPVTLMIAGGHRGRVLCIFVWAVALIGVALKIAFPRRFERLSIVAYLLLGWAVVTIAGPIQAALPPPGLMLLGGGCVLYSIGVAFHLWTRLPYHNAIWHAFVLAAAACHYAMILGVTSGGLA
jgi:hemolysin III